MGRFPSEFRDHDVYFIKLPTKGILGWICQKLGLTEIPIVSQFKGISTHEFKEMMAEMILENEEAEERAKERNKK